MIAMSGEEHTRAGRHCGLETELGGYAEFPGSCCTRISYRIGKMIRALSERGRNHRAAHLHLRARGLFRHFCQHHMIDRMRTNGNERVGGQCGKLVPVHAELVTESSDVDLVAAGEIAYRMTQLILALEAADPLIELLVQMALLRNRRAFEALFLAVDQQPDPLIARDHGLECEPPELPQAIGKAGGNVHRKGNLMSLKNGIGPLHRIAVA